MQDKIDQANIDIAVIIVGLNACDYVRGALKSLYSADWRDKTYEIIYVDNGSTDDSVAMAQSEFPDVELIANDSNLGFCIAANQGAKAANGKYYFFLNDDTIVQDDAIAMLAEFLDQYPQIGVAGSRLLNTDMTDQWSGRKFPSFLNAIFGRRSFLSKIFPNIKPLADYLYKDEVAKGEPFIADWVSAAALMVRKDCFHEIGGFAEDYYYWHEAVFCDRIRNNGHEIILHPGSKIVHYEGKGSGKRTYSVMKFHIKDFHRGAFRCYCEHYQLHKYSPSCWLVAGALSFRASMLLVANYLTNAR